MKCNGEPRQAQRGSALAAVLILLAVASTMAASVAVFGMANTRLSSMQEENMRSYYIARSGAEATYQLLVAVDDTLLGQFKRAVNPSNTVQLDLTATFPEGEAVVTVTSEDWTNPLRRVVKISSVGVATGALADARVTLSFVLEDSAGVPGYGEIFWAR